MSYIDLREHEEKELIPGFFVKFVHTGNMTFAYWRIVEGAALPNHSHHHEQVANLIEGKMEFNLNGEVRMISPGDVVVIPPNVLHSGKAVTECRIIDVFHPAREDYK